MRTAPRAIGRLVGQAWRALLGLGRGIKRSCGDVDKAALVLAVLGLVVVNVTALAIAVEFRSSMAADEAKTAELAAWASFFTVFGIIYAIVAGLLLAELLARWHKLSGIIEEELNAVEDLRDLLLYVDRQDETKLAVFKQLLAYVDSVIEEEWPDMEDAERNIVPTDTSRPLYDLMRAVEPIQVTDPSDQVALQAIIESISEITTHRTQRLEMARQQLSLAIQLLVVFMSFTVVGGFVMLPVDSGGVKSFMVVTGTTAVYLLLVVILDLHRPYQGLWNITRAPFVAIRTKMEEQLEHGFPPAIEVAPAPEIRACPFCKTYIHHLASRCPNCTSILQPVSLTAASG